MADLIDRQAALDAIKAWYADYPLDLQEPIDDCWNSVRELPIVQPEIIRCKDCAKREICRTSNVWAVAPDDDWFCADAERITE